MAKKAQKTRRKASPAAPPAPRVAPAESDRAHSESPCPVVAIGASAGGLEAFGQLLHALPPDIGTALVFIQHLDPFHESLLTELLARNTAIPVITVQDGVRIEPDRVYVIPPNTTMSIRDGVLNLVPRPPAGPHMPIDTFFRSLAEDRGPRAIGVILSGTANDGTLGLKAIKDAGGITMAQDESARYGAMPRNAATAGWVDLVLSPKGIAREIERLCRHPYIARPEEQDAASGKSALTEIFGLLRGSTGVDFTNYKHGTLLRRIQRRMALHKIGDEAQYARMLRENRTEMQSLFRDILISVTSFFREAATFTALRERVFPMLLKNRTAEAPVRMWVPGCSSGEEAYSLVIALLEYMREAGTEIPVQMFGTDLNDAALEQARAGVYPEGIAADVSAERLRRFFSKVEGRYQINRSVRDLCVFAQQNLVKDPPFSNLDLIVCRNVMIYFGPVLQSKVLRLFHYGLKATGYLVLGSSESVGSLGDLFAPIDKRLKIYARRPGVTTLRHFDVGSYEEARQEQHARPAAPVGESEARRRVDELILTRFAPAGVLVDSEMNVMELHGRTAPFLDQAASGVPANLAQMIRGEFAVHLKKVFDRSRKRQTATRSEILSSMLDRPRSLRISVTPVTLPGRSDRDYLVLFEEISEAEVAAPKSEDVKKGTTSKVSRVREMEQELSATREYLKAIIEEHQATTEELKSANEEVQSSNEELQSTNEELLTAKEELQSVNEELTTVNEEMISRNSELAQINNDLGNLLASVNIPIVMLGNDLRIRRFTPQAEKVLNLLPTDVGRPVGDFKPKIDIPDLESLFLDAIENLKVNEREVQGSDGHWYSMWVRPYRTFENKIDGAVMVLFDITDRKQAAEARYRRLFEAAKDGIIIADGEGGEIIDINPFMARTFGISREGTAGIPYWELGLFAGTELNAATLEELHRAETMQRSVTVAGVSGENYRLEILGNMYLEGERRVIQLNLRDITARLRLEEQQRNWNEQAQRARSLEAVRHWGGSVAHDFTNALTAVVGYSDLLSARLGSDGPGREEVECIRLSAERAVPLTRQLLSFGWRPHAESQILDLNAVIDEMIPMLRATLRGRIALDLDMHPDVRPIRGDRSLVEQVILNLVINARDAIGESGRLAIRTENAEIDEAFTRDHPAVPPGGYTCLTASLDVSGAGEMHAPRTSGISTLYRIARRAGGHAWAFTELGRGSTFQIYFSPAAESDERSRTITASGLDKEMNATILLVEDEGMLRGMAAEFLREQGHRVLETGTGADALRISREQAPKIDLLLINMSLPDMTGSEVAQRLAGQQPGMNVMYMSSMSEQADLYHAAMENGAAVLHKPYTPQDLLAGVREALSRSGEEPEA